MKSQIATFESTDHDHLARATRLFELIPQELGDQAETRELVRAMACMLDLPTGSVQDGWYGHIAHSWLWLHLMGGYPTILDVRSVEQLPPVRLVRADFTTGHYSEMGLQPALYREGRTRTDIDHKLVDALIEAMIAAEQTALEEEPSEDGAATWPFLSQTASCRVVIFGGDPRPAAVGRLQRAFRFGSVDWVTVDKAKSVVWQAKNRTVDLVLLLRAFTGHAEYDTLKTACKSNRIPLAVVDRGYGVPQVRTALERALGGST